MQTSKPYTFVGALPAYPLVSDFFAIQAAYCIASIPASQQCSSTHHTCAVFCSCNHHRSKTISFCTSFSTNKKHNQPILAFFTTHIFQSVVYWFRVVIFHIPPPTSPPCLVGNLVSQTSKGKGLGKRSWMDAAVSSITLAVMCHPHPQATNVGTNIKSGPKQCYPLTMWLVHPPPALLLVLSSNSTRYFVATKWPYLQSRLHHHRHLRRPQEMLPGCIGFKQMLSVYTRLNWKILWIPTLDLDYTDPSQNQSWRHGAQIPLIP